MVATVLEPRPACVRETLILYRTLAALGGRLSGARRIAHCVGGLDPADGDRLAALDVSIRPAEAVDARLPYANKVRMLTAEYPDCDHLVALDNDVAVAGDFSASIGAPRLLAKPAEADALSLERWERLYAHFGLAMPAARCVTHLQARETVPYFNSGVLLLPRSLAGALGAAWERYCRSLASEVLGRTGALPFIVPHPPLLDQLALSLAVQDLGLPFTELPLALNFPTHRPIHPSFDPDRVRPLLLHHHHRLAADGALLPCAHPAANAAISAVNGTLCSLPREERLCSTHLDSAGVRIQRRLADSGGQSHEQRGSGAGHPAGVE